MIYTITLNPALDREITVPEMDFDRVLRAKTIKIDYGGKGLNISRALHALGVESIATGFIGGKVGEQMLEGLNHSGIHTDFIHVQGETRTNLSIVDDTHTHYLKVNEPGPNVSDSESSALLDRICSLVENGDCWILAGSPPLGIPPSFIVEIIHRIQSGGANAILDMEGIYLRQGCEANPFMVKPNASEASELLGIQIRNTDEAIECIEKIHRMGAQRVVLSLGKSGAVYSNGSSGWLATPPPIEERNPIGAGDALLAGMVWAFQKNLSESDVIKWGVACGAAAASLDGTAIGSLQLVESLMVRVKVYGVINNTK